MKTKDKSGSDGAAHTGRRVWPAEVRVQVARAVVERDAGAARMAEAFGISLHTVMDWAQRYRRLGAAGLSAGMVTRALRQGDKGRPDGAHRRREAVTAAKREHPEHGVRRIADLLERFEGLGVSETTVRRILHEEGLLEETSAAVAKPRGEEPRFERAEPNQLWQSDIFTFLLRRHERIYVTAFMDDYSRYLVSLVMAHHQKSTLVMEALTRAIADYGAPREVLTDQGRQYTAWRGQTEFEEELRRQGIHHIKSRPHHPQTLGKIERFWKTLWEEFLSRTVFADFEDSQRRVGLFVQAYNFRRPHQGIGGLVPADRFFRSAPQVREAIERSVAQNALALAHQRPPRKPFYLVGRLGDRDLSIALVGSALLVKVGEVEQTIPLQREEEDERTRNARRPAQETVAAEAEVAVELGADRSGGQGAVLDGAERAVRGEAGERGDRAGRDLEGEVLPAGEPGLGGDGEGAGPGAGGDPGTAAEPGASDRDSGGQGEASGASAETGIEALAPDGAAVAGGPPEGLENRLDEGWEHSFAELGPGETEAGFDPGDDWRGRALRWERKLAGADGVRDGEGLYGTTPSASGAAPTLPGGAGGAVGRAHGERGGTAAGDLAQSVSDGDAPGAAGAAPRLGAAEGGAPRPVAAGETTAPAAAPPPAGERTTAQAGGDDGPPAGSGERTSEGTGGAAAEEAK